MSETLTEQREIGDRIESIESGAYIREDDRVEPLRVCEQQPFGGRAVAAVSTRGTVYVIRDEPGAVRKYRGSSVRESIDDMANDGTVSSFSVSSDTPEPRLHIQSDDYQFLGDLPRPRCVVIEGFSIGRITSAWREPYDWEFSPLSLDQSYELRFRQGEMALDDAPLTDYGQGVSFVLKDWF